MIDKDREGMSATRVAKKQITPRDLGLKSDSFTTIDDLDTPVPFTVMNLEGGAKVGKTDWCLRNLPGPIVIFNFDNGLRGMAEKLIRKRGDIIVAGMPLTREQRASGIKYPSYHFMRPIPTASEMRKSDSYFDRVKKLARPIWERFISDYVDFLQSKARSGVVDTGGHCYQLGKFASLGTDKLNDSEIMKRSGDLKSIFQGIITDAYNYNKNVVWTHRLKEKYMEQGVMELEGYRQLPFEVEFTLRLKRRVSRGENVLSAEIRDCRLGKGAKLNGTVFGGPEGDENPPVDFASVMSTITRTDIEIWK